MFVKWIGKLGFVDLFPSNCELNFSLAGDGWAVGWQALWNLELLYIRCNIIWIIYITYFSRSFVCMERLNVLR